MHVWVRMGCGRHTVTVATWPPAGWDTSPLNLPPPVAVDGVCLRSLSLSLNLSLEGKRQQPLDASSCTYHSLFEYIGRRTSVRGFR